MKRPWYTVGAALGAALGVVWAAAIVNAETSNGVIATFEGDKIDLSDGWGEATACVSDDAGTRCYRSEAEMDEAEGSDAPAAMLACSSSLRLYSGTSHSGSVLQLTTQYSNINLSGYGFNNITSSYRVGACWSRFYDGANGNPPQYPGNTSAGASASTMVSGWDNRISSVYIG